MNESSTDKFGDRLEALDASVENLEWYAKGGPENAALTTSMDLTLGVVKKLKDIAVILDQRLSEL